MKHVSADPVLNELAQRGQETFWKGTGTTPRPHQVDAVARLLLALRIDCHAPNATNYLLQHATGSGKSATIALLAHQLVGWEDEQGRTFSLVLVVTDRLQLDKQLADTVTSFLAGNGYTEADVRRAGTAAELSSFLSAPPASPGRPKVVLTTLQKLASVWRATSGRAAGRGPTRSAAAGLSKHRIAVIADEAHRSHGHSTTELMHKLLAAATVGGEVYEATEAAAGPPSGVPPSSGPQTACGQTGAATNQSITKGSKWSRRQVALQETQQQPRSVTYFGFTATPSHRALQLFGVATRVMCDALGEVVGVVGGHGGPAGPTAAQAAGWPAAGTPVAGAARVDGANTAGSCAAGRKDEAGKQSQGQQQVSVPQHVLNGTSAAENKVGSDILGSDGAHGQHGAPKLETAVQYTPFHVFNMQQAVADGHVVDVLLNYTAVTPHLTLAPAGFGVKQHNGDEGDGQGGREGEPEVDPRLMEAAHDSREVVRRKALYIADQFLAAWEAAIDAGFHDIRAMVVARSRRHVVWFTHELRSALAQHPKWQHLCDRAAAQAAAAADKGRAGAVGAAVGSEAGAGARSCKSASANSVSTSVYGAYSGTVGVSEADLDDLDALLHQSQQAALLGSGPGRRTGTRRRENEMERADGEGAAGGTSADTEEEEHDGKGSGGEELGVSGSQGPGSRKRGRAVRRGCVVRQRAAKQLRASSAWDAALAHLDVAPQLASAPQEVQRAMEQGRPGLRSAGSVSRPASGLVSGAGSKLGTGAAGGSGPGVAQATGTPSVRGAGGTRKRLRSAGAGAGRQQDVAGCEAHTQCVPAIDNSSDTKLETGSGGSMHKSEQGDGNCAAGEERTSGGGGSSSSSDGTYEESGSESGSEHEESSEEAYSGSEEGESSGSESSDEEAASEEAGAASGSAADNDSDDEEGIPLLQLKGLKQSAYGPGVMASSCRHCPNSNGAASMEADQQGVGAAAAAARVVQVSERELNGGGRADHRAARILVCCNKFETGYDDPRLGVLFIDRPLASASRAVQVLGRLNRPAPWMCKTAQLVRVYDFVNTATDIRAAFEQFWGPTTLCTGRGSRRLRLELAMDRSVNRLLEALTPLASALAASTAAMQHAGQPGHGTPGSSSSRTPGGLHELSAHAVARLLARMAPAPRASAEADLATYVSAAQALGREQVELPLAFALCLQRELTRLQAHSSQQQRHAARSTAAAAATADGTDGDEETMGVDGLVAGVQSNVGAGGELPGMTVTCELQESFRGAIHVPHGRARPLLSRPLPTCPDLRTEGGGGARGTGSTGSTKQKRKGWAAYQQARAGRPLAEVIAASIQLDDSNAAAQVPPGHKVSSRGSPGAPGVAHAATSASILVPSGAARQPLAACLSDLCARLREATGRGTAAAVSERAAASSSSTDQDEGTAGSSSGISATGGMRCDSSAGRTPCTQVPQEDVHGVLSLLRRLLLWPVDAALLACTQAGREVGQLKKHPNPLVASLASQVVARWKAQVAAQQRAQQDAAAAAAGRDKGRGGAGSKAQAGPAGHGARGNAAEGSSHKQAEIRAKARTMLMDALREHMRLVGAQHASNGAAHVHHPSKLDAPQLQKPPETVIDEQLAALASDMEADVYRKFWAASQPAAGAVTAAASGVTAGRQAYAARLRALLPALKLPDGVSAQLLAGGVAAGEVATMGPAQLAPEAVRQQLEAAARRRAADEAWERAVGVSVGGGTFVAGAKCRSCGSERATVHTVLSGGTYAQERVQVQKFTCQCCNHTWRADD